LSTTGGTWPLMKWIVVRRQRDGLGDREIGAGDLVAHDVLGAAAGRAARQAQQGGEAR
jgi:hypothetical protein